MRLGLFNSGRAISVLRILLPYVLSCDINGRSQGALMLLSTSSRAISLLQKLTIKHASATGSSNRLNVHFINTVKLSTT